MAESIKLANDKYIDAAGIYDSTLGKTQRALNSNTCFYKVVPNGSDINSYFVTGVYSGYQMQNSPDSSTYVTWISIQIDETENYGHQIAFVYGINNIYVRSLVSGYWSAWRTI